MHVSLFELIHRMEEFFVQQPCDLDLHEWVPDQL